MGSLSSTKRFYSLGVPGFGGENNAAIEVSFAFHAPVLSNNV